MRRGIAPFLWSAFFAKRGEFFDSADDAGNKHPPPIRARRSLGGGGGELPTEGTGKKRKEEKDINFLILKGRTFIGLAYGGRREGRQKSVLLSVFQGRIRKGRGEER